MLQIRANACVIQKSNVVTQRSTAQIDSQQRRADVDERGRQHHRPELHGPDEVVPTYGRSGSATIQPIFLLLWGSTNISYYYALVSRTRSVKYWKCCQN